MSLDLRSSVVRIQSGNNHGTGFIISNDGLILTCAHVVNNLKDTEIELPNSQWVFDHSITSFKEVFRLETSQGDILILKVLEELPDYVNPLTLITAQQSKNHNFEAFGFPQSGATNGIPIQGKIIATDNISIRETPHLILDQANAVDGGASGAAIYDVSLKGVVGMINAKTSDAHRGENIAFGIPSDFVVEKFDGISLTNVNEDRIADATINQFDQIPQQIHKLKNKINSITIELKVRTLKSELAHYEQRYAFLEEEMNVLRQERNLAMNSLQKLQFDRIITAKKQEIDEITEAIEQLYIRL